MAIVEPHADIEVGGRVLPVHGSYDEAFAPVVEAFIENHRVEDEVGSSVSVVVDGRTVVDVWGGWVDEARTREWERDTLVCMMSVAKGITAIAFHMLVDRGLVDLDAPVARYWPEFGQNGKEDLPVRFLLDHTAGLPALTGDNKLWPGAMYDRDAMIGALERQAPLWEPGTVAAYHVHTQGYLLGEIMKRVTGKLVGPFVRDEITGPLGADYWMGIPRGEHGRISPLIPSDGPKILAAQAAEDEESLRVLAFAQNPPGTWGEMVNSTEWREMEMPSGSGHGNARAVARIYGALAVGELDGVRLLSENALDTMTTMQHDMIELLQERHYRQGLGILLNSPDAVYMGPHPEAFGHHGIGGSIGFADRAERLGFSYAMNKMHAVGHNGPRARRLIDAVFDCL